MYQKWATEEATTNGGRSGKILTATAAEYSSERERERGRERERERGGGERNWK